MQKDSRKFGTLNYSPYLCCQKDSLFTLQYENRETTTHSCRCLRQAMGGQGI